MKKKDIICFTHILKTSGTSFTKSFIEANFNREEIYHFNGYYRLMGELSDSHKIIKSHIAYGAHIFFPHRNFKYITFLREPINRSISLYYFVKQEKHRNSLYQQTLNSTLKEFYQNPYFHNWQSRCLAGFYYDMPYFQLKCSVYDDFVLKQALHNLKYKYLCFGLLEKFQSSIEIFKKLLSCANYKEVPDQKVTLKRPQISEIDQETLDVIKKANNIDLRLYDSACKLFKKQEDSL